MLSHTTPLKYEPVEVFLSGVDQSKVDRVEIMFENFGVFCDRIVSKEREENEI